jgi:dihydroxyacetone kinase phosphoprotein-dependent L subunit
MSAELNQVIGEVADDVIAARDELNRLDAAAGDGDLGVTMATGGAAVKAILPELSNADTPSLLRRCGSELARKAPSTSGTLLATAFLRAGKAASESSQTDTALLAELLAAAQQGISERGKASPGDKTMLDALGPAVAAVQRAADSGASLHAALVDASAAAQEGAAATKAMRPKIGRASWLAERSEGQVDAGASLVAVIFASAARHVAS